jgi:DHA3 family macrolide efflux protein-like MFS transporter
MYGLSLAGVALVEEQTHSSIQTGLVILSSILPAFLGSLVAGAVVDRWGRRRVLVAGHLARALVALFFWGSTRAFPAGLVPLTVYAVNAAGAACAQFAVSAEMSLLPDLADEAHLMSANALFQFSLLIAEGMGIVFLGPLVIKLAGAPTMGLCGALLYLLALALVAALPHDRSTATQAAEKWPGWAALRSDLEGGWHTIAQDRLLRLVTAQATLAATLLLVLLSLVPGLVSRHLGLSVEDAPFVILPGGLGFVLGAILMSRWERRLSRQAWIAVGLIGVGVSVGLLATLNGPAETASLLSFLGPISCVGLALALVIIPARTVLQERPPAPMRGRVIAAQLALGNAAAVLPLLLGGALADQLGIRPVMGLLSLLAVGAGAVGLHDARG